MKTLALALLVLGAPARAQDPAASMPADTFSYLEVDAGALLRGLPRLDLARLLDDPENRDFFLPLFEQVGADPGRPVASLLEQVPIGQFVAGKAAAGLRGLHFWMKQPDGTETRVEVSSGQPLDARGILDVLGMFASMRMDGGWDLGQLQVECGLDAILILDPGPAVVEHVRQVLGDPGQAGGVIQDVHTDNIAGRSATHVVLDPRRTFGIVTDLYADLEGSRWTVTTNASTFAQIATLDPAQSLATAQGFHTMRQRLATGEPIVFQFTDAAREVALLRNFVPPILTETLDIAGLTSYRGSGFAVNFAEGGVHESAGLLLDGNPDGIWRLCDAMPGGLATARRAPEGAAALVGFKFDPALFLDRVQELADTLLPGTGRRLEAMLAAQFQAMGLDLREEVLGALGDEVGVVVFPPLAPMAPPDWALLWRVRDEESAHVLLGKVQAMAGAAGAPVRFEDAELAGGLAGQRIVIEGVPIQPPALLIHDGWLICAASPQLAARAAQEWGSDGGATLAGASESWQRTLRGLTGGDDEDVALLAWIDLNQIVPLGFGMAAPMIPPEYADSAAAPLPEDLAEFFSGAAIALRHDENAITVDAFSPVGVLLPSLVAGALIARREVVRFEEQPLPLGLGAANPAMQLNNDAWNVVREGGKEPSVYEAALQMALAADRLEPNNPFYLNTLGVASYRAGKYRDAVRTLERANELNRRQQSYHPATDWLFLAMAHWRLGERDQARELLARSQAILQGEGDEELQGFLSEAEALIQQAELRIR